MLSAVLNKRAGRSSEHCRHARLVQKFGGHDRNIAAIFKAFKGLLEPDQKKAPIKPKNRIGFPID
jgi:hypothetical protein